LAVSQATLFIAKLASVERQLNSAIHLAFTQDDELAVQTLGEAALWLLADLGERGPQLDARDKFSRALFNLARDLATGKLGDIPADIAGSTKFATFLKHFRDGMRIGEFRSPSDIAETLQTSAHAKFWRAFNGAATFGKRPETSRPQLRLLTNAGDDCIPECVTNWTSIVGYGTPEIIAYGIFCFGDDPKFGGAMWSQQLAETFATFSKRERRQFCLAYLRALQQAYAQVGFGQRTRLPQLAKQLTAA
jgi:hypothetical protein